MYCMFVLKMGPLSSICVVMYVIYCILSIIYIYFKYTIKCSRKKSCACCYPVLLSIVHKTFGHLSLCIISCLIILFISSSTKAIKTHFSGKCWGCSWIHNN